MHGGYLNKTEGDSIMFHFGGLIDPKVKSLTPKETMIYISTELFYTCVEMQRVCYLFNEANPKLIEDLSDKEEKHTVESAFDIIKYMRNDAVMANAFNALFQIRIRIGANIGEVSIGNFGPPGSKHWDVIGIAVIDAKRMEATAPVGGLRISEAFYNILNENGIVDQYYDEFKQEAKKLGGYFNEITRDELFYFGSVILKDKRNVTFKTFSVQVNPGLPEAIQDQIQLLLQKGDIGAEKIVELVQYYRGNRHVVRAIEDLFRNKGIQLRKGQIIYFMFPERYRKFLRKMQGDKNRVELYIQRKYILFDLLKALGNFQDKLKLPYRAMEQTAIFKEYEQYMNQELQSVNDQYKRTIKNSIHNTYFFHVIFPLVFKSIKASILEYQYKLTHEEISEVTSVDDLEELQDLEDVEEAEAIS
jgi:class 3 adenylate cyclase